MRLAAVGSICGGLVRTSPPENKAFTSRTPSSCTWFFIDTCSCITISLVCLQIWARVAVVTAYVPVATVFVALAATALQDAGSNREESYFVRATEHFQTLITPSHSPRGYATAIAYGVGAIGTLYLGHFFTCIRMESWNSMVQISLDDIRSFRIAEVRDILVVRLAGNSRHAPDLEVFFTDTIGRDRQLRNWCFAILWTIYCGLETGRYIRGFS